MLAHAGTQEVPGGEMGNPARPGLAPATRLAPIASDRTLRALSLREGLPPGPPHLFGKALEPHQVAQALLDGQLEVLPEEGPVDVLLVGLDDGIRLDDEPWWFVHEVTLPDSRHRAATRLAPIGAGAEGLLGGGLAGDHAVGADGGLEILQQGTYSGTSAGRLLVGGVRVGWHPFLATCYDEASGDR